MTNFKTFSRSLLALSLSATLVACGGGGDDESDNPNQTENRVDVETDSGTTVETNLGLGEFVTNGDVNGFAKIDPQTGLTEAMPETAAECVADGSYRYETQHYDIYGPSTLDESDFDTVAGLLEGPFGSFIGREFTVTGLDYTEYFEQRRNIAKFAIDAYVANYKKLPSVKSQLSSDSAGWSDEENAERAWETYINASKSEQLSLVQEAGELLGYSWEAQDVSHGNKLKVCMHTNPDIYTEAFYAGITIAAPSVSFPENYDGFINFSILNMYQIGASNSVHGNPGPKWFADGLAALYQIRSAYPENQYEYDTTFYVSASDEQGINREDILPHYALAYAYFDRTVTDPTMMVQLYVDLSKDPDVYLQRDLPESYGFEYADGFSKENSAFIRAFDNATVYDHEENQITYSDYKYNYHELVEAIKG